MARRTTGGWFGKLTRVPCEKWAGWRERPKAERAVNRPLNGADKKGGRTGLYKGRGDNKSGLGDLITMKKRVGVTMGLWDP